MKKIIGFLGALMMCLSLTSCVTSAYAQVDDIYDNVDFSDDFSVSLSYHDTPSGQWLPLSTSRVMPGDVNGDNTIDVADIATIISVMAGSASGSLADIADVNGDGTVDVADIATIISIMAGKTTQ